MSDEASLMSGASPTFGSRCHCVPSIVLFEVMCTYAAPGVRAISESSGMRLKLSASEVAAIFTVPTFFASFAALSVHVPVMM